ncbi:acetylornithine deacetylase [Drechmeria coniospora]|uniref:Acetylornithine deacetylase n=1 Tax=Drechmeria coniospora TaxID=98403 RepID=A0A151GRV1_DRECN|nr:acetylornithine deacetylase [Drechmeria coniospora]KYK59788.1 acetylornithine deacetylase [Drechmeria coniospora]
MSSRRRPLHRNPAAQSWTAVAPEPAEEMAVEKFHLQFPGGPTRLLPLEDLARELGVAAVYLKDETCRFGLPSFKMLGASWAAFRALVERLRLPTDTSLAVLSETLARKPVTLCAASKGNHGRAVARMGALLAVPVVIYVSSDTHRSTVASLESEGAKVVVGKGTYDDALESARRTAEENRWLLIQDFAFDEHRDMLEWIIDGYRTMMREIDGQLGPVSPTLVVSPAGVGSLAQAAVSHFKQAGRRTRVMTVEPDTAACIYKSLRRNELVSVATGASVMAGLDCGTPSSTAWPTLRSGVDASVTVSDYESHEAIEYLKTRGVFAGPCAGAPLAALCRLDAKDKAALSLDGNSTIVVLCTEGTREYDTPMDVSMDDAVGLTQALARVGSGNPSRGSAPGPGETEMARYIAAWLEHRDIETHWIEHAKGHPSIVARIPGSGADRSFMLGGRIDTVTTLGYGGDAFDGSIQDGELHGRGAMGVESSLAAALVALADAKMQNQAGHVIFATVDDEEGMSIGTEMILGPGWRPDAAITNDPTCESIVHAHTASIGSSQGLQMRSKAHLPPSRISIELHEPFDSLVGRAVGEAVGSKPEFVRQSFFDELCPACRQGQNGPPLATQGRGPVHKEEWEDAASSERVADGLGVRSKLVLCKATMKQRTQPAYVPMKNDAHERQLRFHLGQVLKL